MVESDNTGEAGQSFHVRLKPEPAFLISTTTAVSDRLEITESTGFANFGLYRRVSRELLTSLASERDKEKPQSDRWHRLNDIIQVAESASVICESDLGNYPCVDLNWY